MKMNPAAGRIRRKAVEKNSLYTLPATQSGMMKMISRSGDTQYHGLIKETIIMLKARMILVNGLSLCSALSRFT
jgi:hypothetical protein